MSGKKIAYIISDIDKSLEFEWTAKYFSSKYDLLFLLIGKSKTPLTSYLQELNVKFIVISDEEFPSSIQKWFRVLTVLRHEKPQVIHAHMWRGTLLALTTAYLLRIKKRIFTRHHAIVHYRSDPSGRKWDVLCNWLATDIIAISLNVRNILIDHDHADPAKVHLIHHGFDLSYFSTTDMKRIHDVRSRNSIGGGRPVIGVISRYLELKGIQFIIPAFQKLRERHTSAHLVLANAHGDYAGTIKAKLQELPPDSYTEILFENDIASLYRLFDVFIHVPVDEKEEAFGQTYVEALACGVPSVVSLSGVATEFIRDGFNALVVPYRDPVSIAQGIHQILTDAGLRDSLIRNGKDSAQLFSLDLMLSKLQNLYG